MHFYTKKPKNALIMNCLSNTAFLPVFMTMPFYYVYLYNALSQKFKSTHPQIQLRIANYALRIVYAYICFISFSYSFVIFGRIISCFAESSFPTSKLFAINVIFVIFSQLLNPLSCETCLFTIFIIIL